jgi:hypothetical protein
VNPPNNPKVIQDLADFFQPETFAPIHLPLEPRPPFTETLEHLAIFDWCKKHRPGGSHLGMLIIEALAGTGKTSVLLEILERSLANPACERIFLGAFGRPIVNELQMKTRERGIFAGNRLVIDTAHGMGKQILDKYFGMTLEVERDRLGRLVDGRWKSSQAMRKLCDKIGGSTTVVKAVGLAMQLGIDLDPIQNLFWAAEEHMDLALVHYGLVSPICKQETREELVQVVQELLVDLTIETLETLDQGISFDQMIYLPMQQKVEREDVQFDLVLVDEAQDLGLCRQALLASLLRPPRQTMTAFTTNHDPASAGRMIAVGDQHQAIMGFSGADAKAMESLPRQVLYSLFGEQMNNLKVLNKFEQTQLPLSMSWRCPEAQVEWARQWVPGYRAAPGAAKGVPPEEIAEQEFYRRYLRGNELLGGGDVILCRNSAPLVPLALKFLQQGMRVEILGLDIKANLLRRLKENWKRTQAQFGKQASLMNLLQVLDEQVQALEDEEERYAAVEADWLRCLVFYVEAELAKTVQLLQTIDLIIEEINRNFVDEQQGGRSLKLQLSTVHKAKGKEWPGKTFLWGRNLFMPSGWARQDWEMDQEENLIYIAGTRVKGEGRFIEVVLPEMRKKKGLKGE